jgi:hypothetical protein
MKYMDCKQKEALNEKIALAFGCKRDIRACYKGHSPQMGWERCDAPECKEEHFWCWRYPDSRIGHKELFTDFCGDFNAHIEWTITPAMARFGKVVICQHLAAMMLNYEPKEWALEFSIDLQQLIDHHEQGNDSNEELRLTLDKMGFKLK